MVWKKQDVYWQKRNDKQGLKQNYVGVKKIKKLKLKCQN